MAQSFSTPDSTLIIPGAYAQVKVQPAIAGLSTTGVLMLIGEADVGPRFSQETDLEANMFGADQLASVVAKYKSGPLVDAFRAASVPADDPAITGAPAGIVLVKTNLGTKASGALPKVGGGTYGTLYDQSYGKLGNLIYWQTTAAVAEVIPTTGPFTYIPAVGTVQYEIRVNGAAGVGSTLSADTAPNDFVTAVDGLTGVAATGGVNRGILSVSGTLLVTANPGGAGANVIDVTRSVNWAAAPVPGDTLVIPMGSVIAGVGNVNVGAYVITSVGAATLRATKLSDAGLVGAVPGVITAPINVSPAATISAVTDAQAFSPVTITLETGNTIDGVGKSLEIAQLTGGTDLLSRTTYLFGTTSVVGWVSKSGSAQLLTSAAEQKVSLATNRQIDSINEVLTAGGDVALKIGYTGTSATLTITDTALTTTVVGGSGGNLSITLTDFPTISDLATFISSRPGYTCAVGTAVLGALPSTALDNVTSAGVSTSFGVQAGRIKVDAYKFFKTVSTQSVLVQLGNPAAQAGAGLPDVTTSVAYLSGGAKGASANSDFTAAIDALALVRGNFVVPLVSRDATADIADGLTDPSSTYTVDSINAYVKTHVLAMSTLKKQKSRQAFLSKEDSFANVREAAANIASFRCSMAFQDFKTIDGTGNIAQFQPWMGAVFAAAMQAAGFYKAIFNKGINCNGILMRDGSYDYRNDTQVEDALTSGLLPAQKSLDGGFTFVSDQTTYGKDSNTVFNSIQAVYAADVVALSAAQAMQKVFLGQSTADISASIALTALEGILDGFRRLKLLSPSDDAPKGYRDLVVKIIGPALVCSASIKLSGSLYFLPVTFSVTPVTQSANG